MILYDNKQINAVLCDSNPERHLLALIIMRLIEIEESLKEISDKLDKY